MESVNTGSYRIREQPPAGELAELAGSLNLPVSIAALAWQRGIRTRAEWDAFSSHASLDLHDPHLLPDMDKALQRLHLAIDRKEKVMVHGDYDVDGLTGTAILIRAFRELGLDARPFIPARGKDGYGLSKRALGNAIDKEVSLLVSVDCGSSDGESICEVSQKGLDVIVTDHHLCADLPDACAFVSTQRTDSEYPHKNLSGSAIAYKLAHALFESLGRKQDPERWLDLAALGTVADVMPLRGENRRIVAGGLREMSRRMTAPRGSSASLPAWSALQGRQKGGIRELNTGDLAFRLAPRLNAPGRMGDANISLNLLLSDSEKEAETLAREINRQNKNRQEVEARITAEARELALEKIRTSKAAGRNPGILVLCKEGWSRGILGISAARLVDEFNIPAILLAPDENGCASGSGRGVEGCDLKASLDEVAEHLARHGGHPRAVGLSVKAGELEELVRKLESQLPPPCTRPRPQADVELKLEDADRPFLDALELLEPFGEGNPEPCFLVRAAVAQDRKVIQGKHLKLVFSQGGSKKEAIAFNGSSRLLPRFEKGVEIDLLLRIVRDTFNRKAGEHSIGFHLVDFQARKVEE